jgi:hypothetical protein
MVRPRASNACTVASTGGMSFAISVVGAVDGSNQALE